MNNYLSTFTNTNGLAFPDTLGINATGPGATDGTEFIKAMVDDAWGARYALLDHTGLTPDGITEGPGASQVIDAMNLMAGAPGTGSEWLLADDPGVTGHRALLRQGQGILIANYPNLEAIYVGDVNNASVAAGGGAFYKASDAAGTTPDTAGPYLILDETRGLVPRGLDLAASIDPDGAGRFLGDLQGDTTQGHIHYSGIADDVNGLGVYGETGADLPGLSTRNVTTAVAARNVQPITSLPKSDGVNGTPRTSTETRMYNRSTVSVIWY